MVYEGYKTSVDYGKLKTLLDNGYKVIGFTKNVLVTIQKAEETWFEYVAYGLYGCDLSMNCYKGSDFYAWCRTNQIEWLPPSTKKSRLAEKLTTIFNGCDCKNCGGVNSIKFLGTDGSGVNVYQCKHCGKEYF